MERERERETERERDLAQDQDSLFFGLWFPFAFVMAAVGASIEQIAELIQKGNADLHQTICKELKEQLMEVLDNTITEKLKVHEEKFMAELLKLRVRQDALEKSLGASDPWHRAAAGVGGGRGGAAKRARSEPRRPEADQTKPVVVLAGFPWDSRKKDIDAWVKEQLAARPEWADLVGFAPGVRSSLALIKTSCQEDVWDFVMRWKNEEHIYKGVAIRARSDKSKEQRETNGRVWGMLKYLETKFPKTEFDPDYKGASVWIPAGKVVSWEPDSKDYIWNEGLLKEQAMEVDEEEAKKAALSPPRK